jgi:hypothetical protein
MNKNVESVKQKRSRGLAGRRSKSVNESGELIAGEPRVHMAPGEYVGVGIDVEKKSCFGSQKKLMIQFRLVGGVFDGSKVSLIRNYNLTAGTDLYRFMTIALGRLPYKHERLSKKIFVGKMFRLRIRDVGNRVYNGAERPSCMVYSVVDEILEVLTGPGSMS